jgi:hypothetical protein
MPRTTISSPESRWENFGQRYIAWLLSWFGGVWVLSALGDVVGGFDCSASGLA